MLHEIPNFSIEYCQKYGLFIYVLCLSPACVPIVVTCLPPSRDGSVTYHRNTHSSPCQESLGWTVPYLIISSMKTKSHVNYLSIIGPICGKPPVRWLRHREGQGYFCSGCHSFLNKTVHLPMKSHTIWQFMVIILSILTRNNSYITSPEPKFLWCRCRAVYGTTNHRNKLLFPIQYLGQVTKVRLSCYLVLLSVDSKTR